MNTTVVTVSGMTCGCCVTSVRKEVERVSGVTAVAVDLGTGAVSIESTTPIDPDLIASAIGRAGYTVTE
ncbi:heavy-metal-associated domain-containing protein [Nocardia carnea]|uniref:heavy-metal-associated domain-containing protein n=1 Tax=Nocardia carnea TaxID=37328 RepID=UPI0024553CA1|nr:heavy metal-associated domain-containing protein [Nocardia carnea]